MQLAYREPELPSGGFDRGGGLDPPHEILGPPLLVGGQARQDVVVHGFDDDTRAYLAGRSEKARRTARHTSRRPLPPDSARVVRALTRCLCSRRYSRTCGFRFSASAVAPPVTRSQASRTASLISSQVEVFSLRCS